MKQLVLPLITASALAALCLSVYNFFSAPKIAYVRSGELVYNYAGMKEAQQQQEAKTKQLQANLDTLRLDFQRSVSAYNQEASQLDAKGRAERERVLQLQQQNIQQYAQSVQQKAEEEDERITQGVLNQINAFVETYSKDRGYTVVFGTTSSGNILYGETAYDITGDVLKALNASYKSEPAGK